MTTKIPLFLALIMGPLALSAQKISIKQMEMANDRLVVHYEIDDTNPNNEYLVSLFASKDNFSAPLTKVSGDVGQEVKPGLRKIQWDIRSEYGNFVGPLSVEVRANVFVPFVRLKTFIESRSYKRGKAYNLEWRPGNTNPIHIELFRGNQRMQGELNHPNNGSYSVNLAKGLKPGKDYKLKITDSRHADDYIYTGTFKVRRKLPIILAAVPVAALGYLGYTLFGGQNEEDKLPDPPAEP